MLPLLHWHLNSLCSERIPKHVRDQLLVCFLAVTRRNCALVAELSAIVALFEAHGIPVLPFKGPTLAAALYRNISLRPFCDLDLLVKKRDLLKARALLASRGYQSTHYPISETRTAAIRDSSGVLVLRSLAGRMSVDLHWRLAPEWFRFTLDFDQLWARRWRITIGTHTFNTFSSEDLLLYLCFHGGKHQWERLEWICAVAELIKANTEIDWAYITQQALRLGNTRALSLGLVLSRDLLQAPLPPDLASQLSADPAVALLARRIWNRLCGKTHNGPTSVGTALFHLRLHDRWPDKIRFVVTCAVSPGWRDRRLLPLPSVLFWLSPVLRFFRLLIRCALEGVREKG